MPNFTMKKTLLLAAALCSISFAGNAADNKVKSAGIVLKPMTITKACKLYEREYSCPGGGISVIAYGYTQAEADAVWNYYAINIAC